MQKFKKRQSKSLPKHEAFLFVKILKLFTHKFVFFAKSRLIFNVFYCFTHKLYRYITQEFVNTEINTYSNENFAFLIVIIHFKTFIFLLIYL